MAWVWVWVSSAHTNTHIHQAPTAMTHVGYPYPWQTLLAYTLIYLLWGLLPWFSSVHPSLSNGTILKVKQDTTVDELCDGLPLKFTSFLQYSCSFAYAVKPNYNCYGFSLFPPVLVHLLRWRSLVPFNRYTISFYSLYSFALLIAAMRIASPLLFHHSYAFFPSSYALPLGLCAFPCSINTSSVLM